MSMDKNQVREVIAKRVAMEFHDGDLVNLGIGLPTEVANYVPDDIEVIFQSENGFIGMGPAPEKGKEIRNLVNAGSMPCTVLPGAAYFDSATSFAIIRGGHLDYTVLGALQVDAKGNLANWMIPGKKVPGMGGAMDLVTGAKHVIVAMEHTAKGDIKILEECTLPLTAAGAVDMIVTEMGVMVVTDAGLKLVEYNPEFTLDEIQAATGCKLIIDENLKVMKSV
jgi:acetate CoA/acetoacetate CoA-transferase beta subunit